MKTIGRYQIQSELGRGGMATVYRAFDPRFGRDVAIKVLPPEFLHDPTFRARFEREAKIIAALEHTAIVPVYDFGEEQGQPYLVMRYMAGGSLADRLRRGPLLPAEAAGVLARIAPALDAAHQRGVVHRDLKPGNILFDEYASPHVADFGIAKLIEASASFTNSGMIGTPAYMSPEQVEGEVAVDGRSDVYSLGVILYEMLSGRRPYEADTPLSQALMHVRKPVPRLQDIMADVPAGVDQVISKAMAKSREARYGTAEEMAIALAQACTVVASSPTQAMMPPHRAQLPAFGSQPLPARRRSLWTAAVLSAIVMGAVALLVLFSTANRNESPDPASAPQIDIAAAVSTASPTPSTPTSVVASALLQPTPQLASTTEEHPATATPTASAMPTPTPSPTPSLASAPTLRSTQTVNVRSGPATAYPSLGQLRSGAVVEVTGQNPARTWWQVCCVNGQSGWVLAELFPASDGTDVPVIDSLPPPPVSGRIVFGSDMNGFSHIFVIPGTGGVPQAITAGPEYYWNPIWNRDGSRLAYVSKVGGNTEVFISGISGDNARNVSNHPALDDHPAWFPNNRELVLASDRSGSWQLYRIDTDGQDQRQLTFSGSDNRFPDVAPNGSRIAYVTVGGVYPTVELMVMNSDGSDSRAVLTYSSRKQRDDVGRYVFRPDWSPDGTSLLFGADLEDTGLITVVKVNVDTGEVRTLIENANSPAWSPEGQRIVYKLAGEDQVLHVADATGKHLYQLTTPEYYSWSPDWAP